MNSHTKRYCLILSSVLVCASATAALAQEAAPAKMANSALLTVAISKIVINQKQLTMQFTLKNNAKGRAYILNAKGDRKQSGSFGSGEQMNQPPHVTGLDFCEDTLQHCSGPVFTRDLARFTIVEPGDMTSFSLGWPLEPRAEMWPMITWSLH